jgi:hypothetical protein
MLAIRTYIRRILTQFYKEKVKLFEETDRILTLFVWKQNIQQELNTNGTLGAEQIG